MASSNNTTGLDAFGFRTREINPNNGAPADISSTSAPTSLSARGFGSWREGFTSWAGSSPIAAKAIAEDAQNEPPSDNDGEEDESESDASTLRPTNHSMSNAYRRPSFVASGPRGTAFSGQVLGENVHLSKKERERIREEERSLLRDNSLIPPKHPQKMGSEDNSGSKMRKKFSISGLRKVKSGPTGDEESGVPELMVEDADDLPSETSALLARNPSLPYGGQASPKTIDKRWEEAVTAGKIQTTWQREAKVLGKYSRSLILTFILQYSLTMASIFTVGHIGKVELGAVSLASMTANITGYAVYQGLSTSLDTLCAQAYGSGRKTLVGLQMQRMIYFLWAVTIPIGIIWLSGARILSVIVPEKETARLAGLYLKVILAGAPGYAAFESGKRFLQAQGLFSATLYVLLICAPLNAFLNWFFVWHLGWGFVGAPIAVAITDNLLPLTLFLYVYFIDGRQCWGGFSKNALKNWVPMVRLALPGLVMVLAEFLAFEILTLAASWIGSTHLAAQSVLSTITALTFQIPFPMSIAASTRIANLIGATLADAGKVAAKVALVAAVFVGLLNVTLLSSLRNFIPRLFTNDDDVIALVAQILPLCAAFQLFDALAANCNGILRGLGRQEIGGYVNLFAYYVIAMPISFGTGFGLGWGLVGLWTGPAIALFLVFAIEGWFIKNTSWERAVEDARLRNATA